MNLTTTVQTTGRRLTRQQIAELRVRCQREPESIPLHREAVAALLPAGLWQEALPLLRRLAALCPDDADVAAQLAAVLTEQGDHRAALEQRRRVAKLNPDSIEAQHNLGIAACEVEEHATAIEAFQRKLALDPGSFETHNDLAVLYSMIGKPDDAARSYTSCLEINPRYAKGQDNAFGFFWEQHRHKEGLRLAEKLLETLGSDAEISCWRDRFADPDTARADRTPENDQRRRGRSGSSPRVVDRKIAFVASSDTFLNPIRARLAEHNTIRTFSGSSREELAELLQWADLTWFEWCDRFAVDGSHLPKSGKSVCRLHSYEAFTDAPARMNWKSIDRLILVNRSVEEILDQFWTIPVSRSIIHNGIDPREFPFHARTCRGKRIASVGYINYKKNPSLLLQTFKAIHDWDPEFEFHIAGEHQDPRIKVYFEQLLPRLQLPITFHGWVDDMPSFYAGMDYVISTSLFESFHYSIAEGMLSGCLPLIHTWKGADRLYPHAGLFDTPAQAIECIKTYRAGDTERVAREDRQFIIERYNWNDRFEEIDRVLDEVLTGERRPLTLKNGTRTGRKQREQPETGHGLVSIVIPAADDSTTIEETVASAINQTYDNCEIIVCDDGSTDDTESCLEAFADEITVIRQVRRGLGAALNRAIQVSHGRFIAPLLPGDTFDSRKIEAQVARLASDTGLGFVSCRVEGPSGSPGAERNTPATFPVSGILFRRDLLARTGWFDECDPGGEDDRAAVNSLWRRMLAVTNSDVLDTPLLRVAGYRNVPEAVARRVEAIHERWTETTQVLENPDRLRPAGQASRTNEKSGPRIVFVGARDPGGQMAMWARAINDYTTCRARVLTHTERHGLPSDLVIKRPGPAAAGTGERRSSMRVIEEAEAIAREADIVVFAAGLAPGCRRADARLTDTEEQPYGTIHWPDVLSGKKRVALLFGTPSVRANLSWYRDLFAARRWPVLTCEPDIHRRLVKSRYLPRLLYTPGDRYTRAPRLDERVAVVHPIQREDSEGRTMIREAAETLSGCCPQAVFGRYGDMEWSEVLEMKRRAQIGFDRVAVGRGHFGLDSLENSALGLLNIVYCDPYARALMTRTLGTDECPWEMPTTTTELVETLKRYIADPTLLAEAMERTGQWFTRYWDERRLVPLVVRALTEF